MRSIGWIQNRWFFIIALLLLPCLVEGCAGKQEALTKDTHFQAETRDVDSLRQNLSPHADKAGSNKRLLTESDQAKRNERYNRLFFSPWEQARGSIKPRDAFGEMDRLSRLRKQGKPAGYAENLRPWTDARWNAVVANAARATYPSRADKAITVHSAPLRSLPTHSPWFVHPAQPGQGFPFDMLQATTLPPGTPVLVLHASADGAWLFVETALLSGWIPTEDTAFVDASARAKYRTGQYAAILHDNVSLRDTAGRYLTLAHIGAILPIVQTNADSLCVLVPARDATGQAVLCESVVSADDAAPKPLVLTPGNVARLGNAIMGQPYGWGGLLENRDCSLMIRDMFAPFGIWLPRNSSVQGKSWSTVSLKGLSNDEKMKKILREGRPFGSLLWLPGHITLYVGENKGEPIIFHDIWGVRTRGDGRVSGRFIIGRAAITTTRPGRELSEVAPDALLINRIARMTTLPAF